MSTHDKGYQSRLRAYLGMSTVVSRRESQQKRGSKLAASLLSVVTRVVAVSSSQRRATKGFGGTKLGATVYHYHPQPRGGDDRFTGGDRQPVVSWVISRSGMVMGGKASDGYDNLVGVVF